MNSKGLELGLDIGFKGRALGPGYDAAAIAIFNAMSTPPDSARRVIINNLVLALKAADIWNFLDFFYVLAAADEQAGRVNWINPGTWTLTAGGTPTFTADRGFAGNGVDAGLSMGVPLNTMTKMLLNNASVGAWVQASPTPDENAAVFGTATGITTFLNPKNTNQVNSRFNDATSLNSNSTATIGPFVLDRSGSAGYDIYVDGSVLMNKVATSTALSTINFQFLRAATFSTRRLSAGWGGASLGATKQLALRNALATYHTALGA